MSQARLIVRYRLLGFFRWLKANLFTLFILGPIILIGFYFILKPYLFLLKERVASFVVTHELNDLYPVSFALAILLITLTLSATLKEVFATHGADAYLDDLPIPDRTRFHVVLLFRLLKNLVAWAAFLILIGTMGTGRGFTSRLLLFFAPVAFLGFFVLSLVQILAVLVLVHFRLFGGSRIFMQSAILLSLVLLSPVHHVFLWPLFPMATPALVIEAAFREILGMDRARDLIIGQLWIHILLMVGLYVGSWMAYSKWRGEDRERARELLSRARPSGRRFLTWLSRWLGQQIGAQLYRDWLMTRRVFSSAVYLSVGFSVLFQSIAVYALSRYDLSEVWFARIGLIGGALSAFSIAALGPLLLKHQLPYFWVEKSVGVDREQIWRAKYWYACLLAVPCFFLLTVVLLSQNPFGIKTGALLALKGLIVVFVVASIVGVLTFEIASRPTLGLVFSGVASLMVAGLFIFYWPVWPLWLYGYVMVMRSLGQRAHARVYFTEVET